MTSVISVLRRIHSFHFSSRNDIPSIGPPIVLCATLSFSCEALGSVEVSDPYVFSWSRPLFLIVCPMDIVHFTSNHGFNLPNAAHVRPIIRPIQFSKTFHTFIFYLWFLESQNYGKEPRLEFFSPPKKSLTYSGSPVQWFCLKLYKQKWWIHITDFQIVLILIDKRIEVFYFT